MKIFIGRDSDELGRKAAEFAAKKINAAITEKGEARIVLSTGTSQFDTLKYLAQADIDWNKVTMFHLDEYVGLPETHNASFRKYLKERFVNVVHPGKTFFVNGEGNVHENIEILTKELRSEPVDVSLVGIGENAHVAFNDPPADFDTREAYIVVSLAEKCRRQQVGEGWFKSVDDVPSEAISMTVWQILQTGTIVSSVPGKRKAQAIHDLLSSKEITNKIPSTKLFDHPEWYLFIDKDAASMTDPVYLKDREKIN